MRKILPHAAIIISMMYFVFFFIDRVNTAMAFINNDMTKVLICTLCIISIVNAVLIIADDRRRVRTAQRQVRRSEAPQQRVQPRPQPRPMPRSEYDRRDYEPRRYR